MIKIQVPSRLHFGLLSFGNSSVPTYGGAGLMIDHPRLELIADNHEGFQAQGSHTQRIHEFANHWAKYYQIKLPACSISASGTSYQHQGFGLGTQLALATATALNHFTDRKEIEARELAESVGRAKRSCIGTYGFKHGGFIYECKQSISSEFSDLITHCNIPDQWRFLLVMQPNAAGCHGVAENHAFKKIPPVPAKTSDQLTGILTQQMIPALQAEAFEEFSDAVYEYGYLAGLCYKTVQHGAYMNQLCQQIVTAFREDNILGVGQSSWGPTIFALCPSETAAQQAKDRVLRTFKDTQLECKIAKPSNDGATITTHAECSSS